MTKRRDIILLSGILFIVSISVFLSFKALTEAFTNNTFSAQIVSAIMGTVITITITAILLKAQATAEENKEKGLGVFQEKLKLYMEFVDCMWGILKDDKITSEERIELAKWACRISLIAGKQTVVVTEEFIRVITEIGKHRYGELSDEERKHWEAIHAEMDPRLPAVRANFPSFGKIVYYLRLDLGDYNVSDVESSRESVVSIDYLVRNVREF